MQNNDRKRLKVLVCGAGSIGMRHIKNLVSLGADVVIWRSRAELAKKLSKDLGLPVFTSLRDALINVDAVIIATSTDKHLDIAIAAANLDKAIFIEKPISNSLKGLKELRNIVDKIADGKNGFAQKWFNPIVMERAGITKDEDVKEFSNWEPDE